MPKPTKSMWGNKPDSSLAVKGFWKYNWPSIIWAAFVLWLSLSPQKGLPLIPITHFDKVVHTTFYFILAALMYFGWTQQMTFTFLHRRTLWIILIAASLYGLSIEMLQEIFTTDRYFSWWDEAANVTGAGIGLLFLRRFLLVKT